MPVFCNQHGDTFSFDLPPEDEAGLTEADR